MFGTNSIDRLKESLGYEQWVLENAIDLLRRRNGKINFRRYVINDDYSLSAEMRALEYVGSNQAANVINDLSPLLFNAAYKILDMLMEWIIKENEVECGWKFVEKIEKLDSIGSTLVLPHPFVNEPAIFSKFIGLYKNLLRYRNALTHGVWGKNQSGNLIFDFNKKNGRRVQGTIDFEQVIRFADCMSLTAREATNPSTDNNNILLSIKWCLDSLQAQHKQSLFGITNACYYDIVRRIETFSTDFPSVDIKTIRSILDEESLGNPYGYSLRIEARVDEVSTVWVIPSSLIGSRDELILDSSWDSFK